MRATQYTPVNGSIPYDVLHYDDLYDFTRCAHAVLPIDSHVTIDDDEWIGRKFKHRRSAIEALDEPWPEGLEILDGMSRAIDDMHLSSPVSRRRRRAYDEIDGDDVDLDRLRSGGEYWQTRKRRQHVGPTEFAVVVNVATSASLDSSTVIWRGAAAIALTESLERAGYRVELFATQICTSLWRMHSGERGRKNRTGKYFDGTGYKSLNGALCVPLKRAFDPIDRSSLVNLLSGWAFRTTWFMNMQDRHNKQIGGISHTESHLGTPTLATTGLLEEMLSRDSQSTQFVMFDKDIQSEKDAIELLKDTVSDVNDCTYA